MNSNMKRIQSLESPGSASWRDHMMAEASERSSNRSSFINSDSGIYAESTNQGEADYQTDCSSPPPSHFGYNHKDMSDCSEKVEDFRDREYPQLRGKVYLDHGGSTLYARSLVEDFSADLITNLYGNPHSASGPSTLAGHRIDGIRDKALRFFNANSSDWELVFVANATAAIKLVIECFRDHAAATNSPVWYGYHRDAHTSIVGGRELANTHRCFTSDEEVDLWISSRGLGGPRSRQLGLFAYPGQSNMTGRRLPLSWPGRIRKAFHKSATYTLLDAAALASTAALDLGDVTTAPDFVALSFYKIFGFPNVGALLVRKDSQHVLGRRRYFGGGTVDMIISVNDSWHAKKEASLHERLEDGTLPFHSIFAIDHAIDVHERLYGPDPMRFISQHTAQLGKKLYDGLVDLRHGNGRPLTITYKDENAIYGDPSSQGATVAFNLQRADGSWVGYERVEQAADKRGIYVRSGSLCNPGGVATYLKWSPAEMRAAFAAGHRCSTPFQVMMGKPTGVVRVSLGAMSILADVSALLNFLKDTYLDVEVLPDTAQLVQEVAERTIAVKYAPRPATSNSMQASSLHNPEADRSARLQPFGPVPEHSNSAAATSNAATWSSNFAASVEATPVMPVRAPSNASDYTPPMLRHHYRDASKPFREVTMEIRSRADHEKTIPPRPTISDVKSHKFGRGVISLLQRRGKAAGPSRSGPP